MNSNDHDNSVNREMYLGPRKLEQDFVGAVTIQIRYPLAALACDPGDRRIERGGARAEAVTRNPSALSAVSRTRDPQPIN